MNPAHVRAVRQADQDGQTIILIVGYLVVALLATSAMLAATTVNTVARKLQSVADGAAAAAADSYSLAGGGGGGAVDLVLGDADVRAAAAGYAADVGAPARFEAFAIGSATAGPGGDTARVTLHATVDPPIVGWIIPAGVPITVESSARTVLVR